MKVLKDSTRIPIYFICPDDFTDEELTPFLCRPGAVPINVLSADTTCLGDVEGTGIEILLDFTSELITEGTYVLEIRNDNNRIVSTGRIFVYDYPEPIPEE